MLWPWVLVFRFKKVTGLPSVKHCSATCSRSNHTIGAMNGEVVKVPLISVVVPVYNKISTLSASLECLYQQTFRNFEIIAVDDGSSDGSLELLKRHERAGRLRLYRPATPGPGGHAARNHGAEQAKAEWLVFFDVDDLLLFDHLSCFADGIARYPEIELFINAYQKMKEHQRLPRSEQIQSGVLERYDALMAFARYDFIHMNGACLRRDRFKALGGFPAERYRRGGDIYFWLKTLCNLETIYYNNVVTSLWQLEHSGITHDRNNLANIHPCVDVLSECENNLPWRERRQLRAAVNRKVLSWALEKKRLGQSIRRDLASIRCSSMRLRHWLHMAMLLVPYPYYDKLKKWLK
ncbi:glycosyltransferase family A protein [Halomonas sp. DQ26W]|uniref:glycosyltransferase family A protein n=1 Tax=Halomonas sp. DQ26W TaxID=2282311 RepID=UPI0015F0F911|nr:glycosyltransferase family A protein [Halomonas sp. DQ26W]